MIEADRKHAMRLQLRDKYSGGQLGFTLVELMVVVLVVAMLSAIAIPGYRGHVVKTHRGAAQACLAQYVQLVERLYTTELTYANAGDLAPPGCATEGNMGNNYVFAVTGETASAYAVQATPTEAFAARDSRCGTLSINHRGEKGVSSGAVDECW